MLRYSTQLFANTDEYLQTSVVKGGNIIMTSFYKGEMKAARLEPLETSLHFRGVWTDFSVLAVLYSILEA